MTLVQAWPGGVEPMTVAIDRATGKPCGQVVDRQPGIKDERGKIVDARPMLLLLTRDGYKTVPLSTVRLEEVR